MGRSMRPPTSFWANESKWVHVSLCRDPWLPPPVVPVSFHHPVSSITSILIIYHHQHYIHPLPWSALHAFTLNIPSPYPQKNSDNSGGKFIRSKNKHVSVPELLPWHFPQGCGALWMALSAHFVWGSIHTFAAHTTHKKDLSSGCSKSSYHLYSVALLLLLAPLKPIWPCSLPAVKNPAAIKCLPLLPNFLLRKDHSSTIYLIHNLRGRTHRGVPSSALRTEPLL